MFKIPNSEELDNFDLRSCSLSPLQKYTDRRGFMYILKDETFPEYIKIGRTSDLYKRLGQYNADKPFRTARMLYVSSIFANVNEVERRILSYMYDNTAPTTLSKEWFMIEHLQKLIDIVTKAEFKENEAIMDLCDEEQHWI